MFSTLKKAGFAVVLTAAAASTATPASAGPVEVMASSRCTVGSSGSCTTGVIPASRGFIDYQVDNRLRPVSCAYQLREVSSGVVRSGIVGAGGVAAGRVAGLSGRYQLELRRCAVGAVGVIDNE